VETYTLLTNMSREKKSQVDDLVKLRRILDNSSDPALKYLISSNDYALESVRRRLSGNFYEIQPHAERFFSLPDSLEPKVFIHPIHPVRPPVMMTSPPLESSQPLPEFQPLSPATQPPSISSCEDLFINEDLFEVEKIEYHVPEFIEVTPIETIQEPQGTSPDTHNGVLPHSEESLPEWQPVEEELPSKSLQKPENQGADDVPEFERVALTPISEEKESTEWSTLSQREEQSESPTDFLPIEPSEASVQKLTKKQQRAAKKAQRKKEKEERKLKKIELKRLQKEKQDQERNAIQAKEEPQPLFVPDEESPKEARFLEVTDEPPINVDYNNFKGIKCINEKTAELLYKNGYFSIENLKDASIDDLVQIHGIKRKHANQIKIEIEEFTTQTDAAEFLPIKQKTSKKKEQKKHLDSAEWESSVSKEKGHKSYSSDVYTYKGYTLHRREARRSDGEKTTLYYFTKKKSDRGHPCRIPEGYRIAVNKKTGVPYLKKKE
jgi:Helix-hairpin-helix domain